MSAYNPNYNVVLVAAGVGTRFGSFSVPKQYFLLKGRPVLEWALEVFLQAKWISEIIIVVHPQDKNIFDFPLILNTRVHVVTGGATRQDSVYAGICFLGEIEACRKDDWVIIHDGVRHCIKLEMLEELRAQLEQDPIGGFLAVPVIDTIKEVKEGRSIKTIAREGQVHALTPQQFKFDLLKCALEEAKKNGQMCTDEANAIELMGFSPKVVMTNYHNPKITLYRDIHVAEMFL